MRWSTSASESLRKIAGQCSRALVWVVLLLGGALFVPAGGASANSMPPIEVWFKWVYEVMPPPRLEGVQLIGCSTSECEGPVLFAQFGKCGSADCLDSPLEMAEPMSLACEADICYLHIPWIDARDYGVPFFRLVAQSADRARVSPSFPSGMVEYEPSNRRVTWLLVVGETGLALTQDVGFRSPVPRYEGFIRSLAFTAAVEIALAAMFLWAWRRMRVLALLGRLGIVALVNLLSYPVVWLVLPALGQFQPAYVRPMAFFTAVMVAIYTAALVGILRLEGKKRWVMLALAALSLLPTAGVAWFVLFVTALGSAGRLAVQGLSSDTVIVLSEAFAVTFEAVLVWLWGRKAFSLAQAGALSLVLNAASFGLGLVFG